MNYSSLVKIVKNPLDYQKAMDGEKSKAIKADPPIGRRYFQNTGIKCEKSRQYRHFFVDAKPAWKSSIYDSAMNDFNKITNELNESEKNLCIKKKMTTVGVDGKRKKKTYAVSKEAFQNMNAGQQFFIGSLSVLGLYLLYKGIYKK